MLISFETSVVAKPNNTHGQGVRPVGRSLLCCARRLLHATLDGMIVIRRGHQRSELPIDGIGLPVSTNLTIKDCKAIP